MPTPLKILLQHAGLRPQEVAVYLASLQLGEATVQEIAQRARLPRTTAASILERLAQSGFVTARTSRGRRRFWIEDPHILVEKEKARLQVFEILSGRLHAEYHQADARPVIEMYDSRQAIETLMTKVIQDAAKGEDFCVFEAPTQKHYQAAISDELFSVLSKHKASKGIQTKALIPQGQAEAIRPSSLDHRVQVRVLPDGLTMDVSFWILGQAIVLFFGTHVFAIRIHHRHTAESFRSLFSYLWKLSATLDEARTNKNPDRTVNRWSGSGDYS